MSSPLSTTGASVEDDVHRIKKKLEKMMRDNQVDVSISLDMLNALKKLPVDLNVLKNTGIGVALNNLRKSSNNDELCTLTKALLKNWKKLVNETTTTTAGGGSPTQLAADSPSNDSPHNNDADTSKTNTTTSSPPDIKNGKVKVEVVDKNSFNERSAKRVKLNNQISYTDTKDQTRLKCRELLAGALEFAEAQDDDAEFFDPKQIAGKCEDTIFEEFRVTNEKYKARVRSRVLNLKDVKNPMLKINVRFGNIAPEVLAKMTAEEMASKELKELRQKFTQEAINDHQMARKMATTNSVLQCKKCKKNNVTYTEMQTRSSDEPMTVFAYCLECGNRWRM